jgi:hypothetical protein
VKTPDRDASIDRLLSRFVPPAETPHASAECLDAETLAAWVDGTLTASEAAMAEAHASSCARCQATLAALVRVVPATSVPEPWWRRRWVMGLVPLTAGAVALAIWIRLPEPANPNLAIVPEVQTQPTAPIEARSEPSAPSEFPPEPSTVRPASPSLERADAPRAHAKQQQQQPPPPPAGFTLKDQEKKADALQKSGDKAVDALGAAPRTAAANAAPLSESVAGQLRANAVEITSPEPASRWRIGAAGSIQRSVDGGATWEMAASGATQDLIAGAAPAPTVCWVVGRGGTVLLTTDGRTWQPVAFPEPVDLVAVQARDGRAATVITADGRTFRTADGGRTWAPVQEF